MKNLAISGSPKLEVITYKSCCKMTYKVKIVDQLIVLCDGTERRNFEIPIIWLRDNCQCSECFHPETFARIIDWDNFDFDVKPVTIEVRFCS